MFQREELSLKTFHTNTGGKVETQGAGGTSLKRPNSGNFMWPNVY